MFNGKFECKDLNKMTAKEEAQLLRIWVGRYAEKILTPEQYQKATEIINQRTNSE